MAKKAFVYDGTNWIDIAQSTADLSNYANMTTTPISGFRNAIINGGFSINQRNESSYTVDGSYTFDRWNLIQGGITSPSVTRTANIAESGLPESIGWYASLSGTNNASTGYFYFGQSIEDVKTFAGQTVTVSFYAKGSVAGTIGTRMLQNFGTGGSSGIYLNSSQGTTGSSHAITTSWQRYSVQYTVPSVVGKTINDANSSLGFNFVRVLGSNYTPASLYGYPSSFNYTGTLSVTGVQIELGSIPTPVERRPVGTELSLCQRYYQVYGFKNQTGLFNLVQYDAASIYGTITLQTKMRAAPTADITNATNAFTKYANSSAIGFATISIIAGGTTDSIVEVSASVSGTAGHACWIRANAATTKVGFSAEL